uniref:CitMHS domain-containing protein n=1 Tax=Steinernema glaseri TaxID=37863 RepID=A0A1I7YPW3_9BILA
MLRDPGFAAGWGALIDAERRRMISDTCIGIFVVFLFFAYRNRPPVSRRSLLSWEVVHRKLPWSVIFLIGSGFAISKAVQASGLSHTVSCIVLDTMRDSTPLQIQATITTVVTFVTECMSNSATASIFIPISLSIAETLHLHPLYLAIPSAIAPSFSFMFPMATAPNAIVYETGVLRMWEMALTGFFLNLMCIGITILNTNTWAFWFFNMSQFPDGIPERNLTTSCGAIA